jgi:hypothetical protein
MVTFPSLFAFSDFSEAFDCGVEAWSGFWGDPVFSGAMMMAAYAFAAFLVIRASSRLFEVERGFWIFSGILMALQVANTPLDLHGLAWASVRCLARTEGWYAQRHAIQREVLTTLALAFTALAAFAMLLLRRDFWRNALLVVGLTLAIGMTLAKGVNYHQLEALYGGAFGPLRTADLVELSGVAAVLTAAWLKLRATSGHNH